LYGYGQGEYLMVETTPTPDVVDNDHNTATLLIMQPKMRQWQG
jgi:hypothetical protein